MKSILLLSLSILLSSVVIAQKKLKKTVYFIDPAPIENEIYKCSFKNGISDKGDCKFAMMIENLTEDYLVIQMNDSKFKLNGEEFTHAEKRVFIEPFDKKTLTYRANPDGVDEKKLHARQMEFEFGGIQRIPANGKIHKAEDFKMPVAKNEIEFEDFKLSLKGSSQETKMTSISFELIYTGDDYAIVRPNKVTASIPDVGDDQFANVLKKGDKLLKKGEKITVRIGFKIAASFADMQFATIMTHFNDAFQTSVAEPVKGATAMFELDPELTKGKH